MGKMISCAKVDPSSGCQHVVRGESDEEVLKRAMEHAKSHGLREVTKEMMATVKAAIQDEHALARKPFSAPDDARPFGGGKGKMEVVSIGGMTIGRGVFEPGWRWSEHVKPIAKTDSCEVNHTGYVLEGRMVVKMNDGTQVEFGAGDAFVMPPGHDAWVVGDARCVLLDFTGVGSFAKAD